jgi:hypothetical protein
MHIPLDPVPMELQATYLRLDRKREPFFKLFRQALKGQLFNFFLTQLTTEWKTLII